MSDSYKKRPVYKWHGRGAKRQSSKAFRRYKGDVPINSRRFDRKIFQSWDVLDNWYWDFDNTERLKEYRLIVKELYRNAYDNHLTEEEMCKLRDRLDEIIQFDDPFFYKYK